MRLLHTADWHLGQTLHGVGRAYEHDRFLAWLLDAVERHAVDALVVAGDVFDVASPSADALARYFGFLAEARRRFAHLELVVVGGNHDAPARLDAARAILEALRVRVIGALPRRPDGTWDLDRILVPLAEDAVLIAVPFLRPKDLPATEEDARRRAGLPPNPDAATEVGSVAELPPLAEGHRLVYRALAEAARARFPEEALVATGHAYVAGGRTSDDSERKVQQGNQQALPTDFFPPPLAYVALGHLHLAQAVSDQPPARYPGSPIPLSMAEIDYPHQVLLVDVAPGRPTTVRSARVPRAVELLRVPPTHAPLDEVLAAIGAERARLDPAAAPETWPLLEVRVRLDAAEPRLRSRIEEALEGAPARLVRIDVVRPEASLEALPPAAELSELSPDEVFEALHRRRRGEPPSPELLAAFAELLEAARQREGSEAPG